MMFLSRKLTSIFGRGISSLFGWAVLGCFHYLVHFGIVLRWVAVVISVIYLFGLVGW